MTAESFDVTAALANQSFQLSFSSSPKQMCIWLQRGGLFVCVLFNDMISSFRLYSIVGGSIVYCWWEHSVLVVGA
jgi:hypothetical protein